MIATTQRFFLGKLGVTGIALAVGLLVLTSAVSTALALLLPALLAPLLDLALAPRTSAAAAAPPASLGGLSLRNLGAAVFGWFGIGAVGDPFRAIVLLAVAYVAVGFLKGCADFAGYLIALWIRARAAAALGDVTAGTMSMGTSG